LVIYALDKDLITSNECRAILIKYFVQSPLNEKPTVDEVAALIVDPKALMIFLKLETRLLQQYDAEVVQDLLTANFIDPFNTLGALKNIILNCSLNSAYFSKKEAPQNFASPVLPLCQRSGSGKTKTMIEIGRRLFPTVYISFRGALKTAHPVELEYMFDELGRKANDDGCKRFFFACASVLLAHLIADNQPFANFSRLFFEQDASIWTTISAEMERLGNLNESEQKEIFDQCGTRNPFGLLKNLGAVEKFVFALDEARHLTKKYEQPNAITSFEAIRTWTATNFSALHGLIVIIVADTSSTITNFSPPATGHNGSPMRSVPLGTELIPPFYHLSGHDFYGSDYLKRCLDLQRAEPSYPSSWANFLAWRERNPLEMACIGSPLWAAYIRLSSTHQEVEKIAEYARNKIVGEVFPVENLKSNAIIAALAIRVGLSILPGTTLAKDLVADRLAQLQYLTRDRKFAYTGYPSDPSLAQGAKLILEYPDYQCMKILDDHMSDNLIDIGNVGEVVVRVLILSAFDSASKAKKPFTSVTVADFFQALLPKDNAPLHAFQKNDVWGGKMFFNHTHILSLSATLSNLQNAFFRGAMLAGYPYQKAWDVCLPVILESGRLGAIYFQVKNWAEMVSDSALDTLFQSAEKRINSTTGSQSLPRLDGSGSLFVLMNLCQGKTTDELKVTINTKKGFISLQGDIKPFLAHVWGGTSSLDPIRNLLSSRSVPDRKRVAECPVHENRLIDEQDMRLQSFDMTSGRLIKMLQPVLPEHRKRNLEDEI